MIELETNSSYGAKIRVIGVGGGGGNAINSMIQRGLNSVDFIAANTDVQALQQNAAPVKIQVGKGATRGLGAGADPSVGQNSVEESLEDIKEAIKDSDMLFVTAGMGGGTGTGGAPVIARIGREMGALVVGIVTKPFQWEARKRNSVAESGIEELRKHVDALIVIPNQRLLTVIDKSTSFKDAFQKVDDVLYNATRGIADIISGHGYINVDFADVRTIMKGMGDALMGIGSAKGENRAREAAQNALNSPLLEGISIAGAQGVLVNISASQSLTMFEVDEAVSIIEAAAGNDVNLIQGIVVDETLEDEIRITVVATGFKQAQAAMRNNKIEQKVQAVAAEHKPEFEVVASVQEVQQQEAQQIAAQKFINVGQREYQQVAVASAGVAVASAAATVPATGGPVPVNPYAGSYAPASIPNGRPTGYKELTSYDEPAYLRRGGSIKISNGGIQASNSYFPPQTPSGQIDKKDDKSSPTEKPAFLRKIMD